MEPIGVKLMKTLSAFFTTILFSANSFSQSSAEVMCRAQAKESAVQTYSNCITQARNTKVEEIRKSYQKELTQLKAKYDQELKQLGASKKTKKSLATTPVTAPTPVKGIAKELPSKVPVEATDTLPIQNVSNGDKVISKASELPSEAPGDLLEKEAEEAGKTELIELPIQ